MFTVNTNIDIGQIVTLMGFIAGGLWFLARMENKITMLSSSMNDKFLLLSTSVNKDVSVQNEKIDNQSKQINDLGQILIAQAVQNERMNNMDRRIEDLRNGRGFIVSPPSDILQS